MSSDSSHTRMMDAALAYLRRGWSVIPVHSPAMPLDKVPDHIRKRVDPESPSYAERDVGKVPFVRWKAFESRLPTEAEVRGWWRKWPDANIGLVTGNVSGVVVVDADEQAAVDLMARRGVTVVSTLAVQSGREGAGFHFYFAAPDSPLGSREPVIEGVPLEIQAEGNYVVVPPSVHRTGRPYEWVSDVDPAAFPEWLTAGTNRSPGLPAEERKRLLKGVGAGQRHDALRRYVPRLVAKGLHLEEILDWAKGWNEKNDPPSTPGDLREHVMRLYEWATGGRPETPDEQLSFPEEAYVGVGREFVDLYSRTTKAPRPFLYFSFLTCLGHLLASKLVLPFAEPQSPRLYTVLVGPSGEGKSTAKNLAVDFFTRLYPDFADRVQHGVGSGEGLARKLQTLDTNLPAPLLLAVDELSILTAKASAEGSILIQLLCSLFDQTSFDNTTKTTDVRVRDGHLSLLSMTTPQRYDTVWKKESLRIGFTNRIWLVWDDAINRDYPTLREISADDRQALVVRVHELVQDIRWGQGEKHIRLSGPAEAEWAAWYRSRMDNSPQVTRLDVLGWRLMMLLSVCRGETSHISGDTVRRVCTLLDHQLMLRRLHDPIDAENAMAEMEQRILKVLGTRGRLQKRDIMRFTHAHHHGLWIFNTALANVVKDKQAKIDRQTGCYMLAPGLS